MLRGWTQAEQGNCDEAIAEIRLGVDKWRAQGSELGSSYFLAILAEACAKSGKTDEGLKVLAEAHEFEDATGEGYWAAEIHRLKGELLLQRDPASTADAEACFDDALEVARKQEAKSLELRSAMSLAGLWKNQGKTNEAFELLSRVHGWFTEGFDSHDLKKAKAMLGGLS